MKYIILFQVVLARSKANLQSDTLSVSLGTSVSINAVANLNPGEMVKITMTNEMLFLTFSVMFVNYILY